MTTRRWLLVGLTINLLVAVGSSGLLGARVLLGESVFCEITDSTWGQQTWTGIIPEPTCVYAGVTVQGVSEVEVAVPARAAPMHLLLVAGVGAAVCGAALTRSSDRRSQPDEPERITSA